MIKASSMTDIIQSYTNFINAIKEMEEIEKQRTEHTAFVESVKKQIFGDNAVNYISCITYDTSGNIHTI